MWCRTLMPLFLIMITLNLKQAEGVCCPSKKIAFHLVDPDDDCDLFDAKKSSNGICEVSICDDGTVVKGSYCGHGSCNIFGCNCDGGCRTGNPIKQFHDFYGDYYISQIYFVL